MLVFQVAATVAQDYEVSDIQCSGAGSAADLLTAKIKRPVGFRGTPLFADDRSANPLADIHCQIRPDPNDPQEDNYFLKVTDFSRCGILKRNVSHRSRVTRNWFLWGVTMMRSSCDLLLTLHKRTERSIRRLHTRWQLLIRNWFPFIAGGINRTLYIQSDQALLSGIIECRYDSSTKRDIS